ncbi:MAG: AMP-binding protein [Alphaproteobacteria bacterium]
MTAQATNTHNLPPFKLLKQLPPQVEIDRRDDGSVLIWQTHDVGEVDKSIAHIFAEKCAEHPERKFICEREGGTGPWNHITYGQAWDQARAVAQAMLDQGMGPQTPLMVLSSNSIKHGVMMLGAMLARVPVAPISVPYSLMSPGHAKLKHVFNVTKPKMVFAEQGALYQAALDDLPLEDVSVITGEEGYDELIATDATDAVDESLAAIDHDTVFKYLFTSGSTGMPKGVIQTHGMMVATIAGGQALRIEEDEEEEAPNTLEWMPWNHISAGNISFNGNLKGGGTLWLDAGKPIPGMFDQTIANLKEISPRVFGSAPVAFGMLADAMEADDDLRKSFFAKLEYMGYGGATLSSDLYDRMQTLAIKETGQRIPFTTMYGATETQGITVVHWVTERVGLIGLPFPGMTLKLVPNGTKMEVRVKGASVTPGYLNDPEKTKDAFDEEGFYSLGDAGKFMDEDDPAQGLVFDGRVTEDFKLSTGTWVSVGTVRPDAVAAATPYVMDAVVCGLDKPYIALLAWPNIPACQALVEGGDQLSVDDLLAREEVRDAVREGLRKHNASGGGSSTRVSRVILMAEPPSIDGHEITDKGYVNQRATLERRGDLADLLYQDPPHASVIEVPKS